MILEETKGIVRSNGILDTTQFRIEASAKMFKMLTNSLYTNKIQSIVRELSSNAYDAHIEANNNTQFEVHSPTYSEPYFYIRDYGNGLSEEKVKDLYTVLGMSDKNESNDFVGCLGIGSKSPFAYTNNFSVTSFQNGKKTIYSCYINEEGIPCISLLDRSNTTEKNGLKIEIGVDKKDIGLWNDYISRNYIFYKLKPKCNICLKDANLNKEFSINDVNVYTSQISSLGSNVIILMGHNVYPLVDESGKQHSFSGVEFTITYGKQLIIEVPIGTVNINLSRERLQFDKSTNANLTNIFNSIKKYLLKDIQDLVNKQKTEYEAFWCVPSMNGIHLSNYLKLLTFNNKTLENIGFQNFDLKGLKGYSISYKYKSCQLKGFSIRKVTDAYRIIIDDSKVSHTYISNYICKQNEHILFIKTKTKEELDKLFKDIIEVGFPESKIEFTSKLNIKKNSNYSPIKVKQLVGFNLHIVSAVPTNKDYYIERKGDTVYIDDTKKRLLSFLKIQPYALTKTQITKYGCKSAIDELPNIIKEFLKKNNIEYHYIVNNFSYLKLFNILKKEFPFFNDYIKEYDNYTCLEQKINSLIPNNISYCFKKYLVSKEISLDEVIEKKYPLFTIMNTNYCNGWTQEQIEEVKKYIRSKNVTSN